LTWKVCGSKRESKRKSRGKGLGHEKGGYIKGGTVLYDKLPYEPKGREIVRERKKKLGRGREGNRSPYRGGSEEEVFTSFHIVMRVGVR